MWFRRLLRRRRKPPPLDLTALDRLEEQIARVIALVPRPEPDPAAQPEAPRANAPEPVEPDPSLPAQPASTHLLFLPGYALAERNGSTPARGARLEHQGTVYVVLRQGPSPLPADRRRCAFLEAV